MTKADTFPFPCIDDLHDQLGKVLLHTKLSQWLLAIHADPGLREKMAFVTPQSLFEFRVMQFGLTNAPAVFQRLVHPESGVDFVSVYLVIYLRSLVHWRNTSFTRMGGADRSPDTSRS